jgi:hypothetical protein
MGFKKLFGAMTSACVVATVLTPMAHAMSPTAGIDEVTSIMGTDQPLIQSAPADTSAPSAPLTKRTNLVINGQSAGNFDPELLVMTGPIVNTNYSGLTDTELASGVVHTFTFQQTNETAQADTLARPAGWSASNGSP